jgi:DinB superfamily
VVEYSDEDLQDSHFVRVNLMGSRFHGVVMQSVKITDAWVNDVEISCLLGSLKVNDVDISAYVRAELDRRHPELPKLRAQDVKGLREAWKIVETQAAATLKRARALPEASLDESVDGEWSYIETLRHLVYATDRWITGPVLGNGQPFHPLGLPNDNLEPWRGSAIDVDAHPTLDEVLPVRQERMETVACLLDEIDRDGLHRTVASPNGGTTSVADCVRIVMSEEWAHNRYANRDLDVLSAT